MSAAESPLAIVTGAGSGIGRAIALRLARAGYRCILAGRRLQPLEETARLADAEGGCAVPVAADVTTPEGRTTILETVDRQSTKLSALVNNAGGSHAAPLFAQDLQTWRDDFALNVEAVAFLSFEAMRRMSQGSGGSIVNIGSVYGIVAPNTALYGDKFPSNTEQGPVRGPAYTASKGALRLLSRELAVAGARMGVRVNTVSPGMIEVERHGSDSAHFKPLADATPMGRLGQPHEIAGAVNFLLSSEASFITGAEIVADGGWTLW